MFEYDLKGKTRSRPLSNDYTSKLGNIVQGIDPTLGIRVTSAGQDRAGPNRTGSKRHDVDENGEAHTADLVLTHNGKPLLPSEHKELYSTLIERAAPHFPGIGHYGWGIHIGGGDEAFWGPDTKGASADPVFAAAFARGRGKTAQAVPTGPQQDPAQGSELSPSRRGQGTPQPATQPATVRSTPTDGFAYPNPDYRSLRDDQAATREAYEDSPGLLEGTGAAISEQWLGAYMLDGVERTGKYKPDLDFRWTEEFHKEVTKGLPEHYHEFVESAYSEEHAMALRERAFELLETDKSLGTMGAMGTVLRIGAAVADPVAIAAGILSGGVAVAGRGAALSRTLRAGTAVAATNAGVEAGLAAGNPNITEESILYAGVFGFVVGGAFGAFQRTPLDESIAEPLNDMMRQMDEAADAQSIGAARNTDHVDLDSLSTAQARAVASEDAPRSAMGKLRFDMVGRLKQSLHPLIRRLGGLAEDGVGNADGSALIMGVTENVGLDMKRYMTMFYRKTEPAYKAWRRSKGIPLWRARLHRDEFFNEVGKAIRRDAGTYTDDVNVNAVAEHVRALQNKLREFGREKGLKGFEDLAENPQYLMRRANHKRIDEMVAQHSEPALRRVVAGAIRALADDIPLEDVQQIAAGYLRALRQSRFDASTLARVFDADQSEVLRDLLTATTDMTPEAINRAVGAVAREAPNAGKIQRAKTRLHVDETYQDPVTGIRFEDLFESNAEHLFTSYTRQLLGAGHMEDFLRGFGEVADGQVPRFETLIQNIRNTAAEYGISRSQLNEDIARAETLYKAAMGLPLGTDNRIGHGLRLLRDYNFIRVMNQVGFAQLAEIGNILGQGGFRAMVQSMPGLKSIWSRARDGSLSDELLDEIEVIWGLGTDRLRQSFTNRMDDYGSFETRAVGQVENALDHGRAVTADISLMAPINMALQRMAGRTAVQRFMNMAGGNKPMSKRRLATLGLTPEDADAIFKQMNKHVKFSEGMLGRKVRRINIDKWDDQDAAQKFITGIDKWTRRIIQENDPGMMQMWMTKDMGKTLIQFRTFMIGAWTKQTLYGMHVRDFDQFQAWAASLFFGGMAYMAQTQINSIGRSDAAEYREKRLSAYEIGKASFQRASFSTFVPAAVDIIATLPGYEPVFAYGRSTGLASGAILGNPTLDLLDKTWKAGQGGFNAIRSDRNYSQQDFRAATSIGPFQNAMIIRNGLNAISGDLPRFSQ